MPQFCNNVLYPIRVASGQDDDEMVQASFCILQQILTKLHLIVTTLCVDKKHFLFVLSVQFHQFFCSFFYPLLCHSKPTFQQAKISPRKVRYSRDF